MNQLSDSIQHTLHTFDSTFLVDSDITIQFDSEYQMQFGASFMIQFDLVLRFDLTTTKMF